MVSSACRAHPGRNNETSMIRIQGNHPTPRMERVERIVQAACQWAGVLLAVAFLVLTLSGCASTDRHNEHGGYRPACGELPPLVGDDC